MQVLRILNSALSCLVVAVSYLVGFLYILPLTIKCKEPCKWHEKETCSFQFTKIKIFGATIHFLALVWLSFSEIDIF